MLKTDNFLVQFEIENVLFTETFRLAYRTEEYKKYWLDGILDKSHCHYQQAQMEALSNAVLRTSIYRQLYWQW